MNSKFVNPFDSNDFKENHLYSNYITSYQDNNHKSLMNPSPLSSFNKSNEANTSFCPKQEKAPSKQATQSPTSSLSTSESPFEFSEEDLSIILSQFSNQSPKKLLNRKRINTSIITAVKTKPKQSKFIRYKHHPSSKGTISVLSYNILNQMYIKKLHREDLSLHHRLTKITKEIIALSPDVFCLQEADVSVHKAYFSSLEGYSTLYGVNCGSSFVNIIGFKRSKYAYKAFTNFSLLFLGKGSGNRGMMQVTLKDVRSGESLTVYNVHFPFKYEGDRVTMTKMIFENIEETKATNVIIAGDFNAEPESTVIKMLYCYPFVKKERGAIEDTGASEAGKELSLSTETEEMMKRVYRKYKLRSSYQCYRKAEGVEEGEKDFKGGDFHPKFTTRTQYFKKTIDYIFFSKTLEPCKILKIPHTKQVEKEKFLPSADFPSDHLKIYCEFALRDSTTLQKKRAKTKEPLDSHQEERL